MKHILNASHIVRLVVGIVLVALSVGVLGFNTVYTIADKPIPFDTVEAGVIAFVLATGTTLVMVWKMLTTKPKSKLEFVTDRALVVFLFAIDLLLGGGRLLQPLIPNILFFAKQFVFVMPLVHLGLLVYQAVTHYRSVADRAGVFAQGHVYVSDEIKIAQLQAQLMVYKQVSQGAVQSFVTPASVNGVPDEVIVPKAEPQP